MSPSLSFIYHLFRRDRLKAGLQTLLDPVGDEHICIALVSIAAVRGENKFFAIGREHRETIESFVIGNTLETRSVEIDYGEIEISLLWVRREILRTKDNAFPVRHKERRKACRVQL